MTDKRAGILALLAAINVLVLGAVFWLENSGPGCDWLCQEQAGVLDSGTAAGLGILASMGLGWAGRAARRADRFRYAAAALAAAATGLAALRLFQPAGLAALFALRLLAVGIFGLMGALLLYAPAVRQAPE